jgi:transcriptional regulator with XRE-family HTH domain
VNGHAAPAVVGPRLRRWRANRNLTGPEIAELLTRACGTPADRAEVGSYERGEHLPDGLTAEALVRVFDESVETLFGPRPVVMFSAWC